MVTLPPLELRSGYAPGRLLYIGPYIKLERSDRELDIARPMSAPCSYNFKLLWLTEPLAGTFL